MGDLKADKIINKLLLDVQVTCLLEKLTRQVWHLGKHFMSAPPSWCHMFFMEYGGSRKDMEE
jgi:hypothetical protein